MLLSVVVPCYNEEEALSETHRRLTAVLASLTDAAYELIYVDDGSADRTAEQLRFLQSGDGCVRVLRLSRNFGHQIAVTAGLEYAVGDAVVIIDADLQDPPEVIVDMLARWREGYQVAYGQRVQREGETPFKLLTAKAFYRLINWLSEIRIPLDVGVRYHGYRWVNRYTPVARIGKSISLFYIPPGGARKPVLPPDATQRPDLLEPPGLPKETE